MLILAVFIAGMTSLAVELAAARLLGNVFGTSNLVWANIIGLILLYLTAGYFIGGRWADRSPNERTFYQVLCWAAFTVGLIPIAARPILLWAAQGVAALNVPVAGGSFIATLLLFGVPVTLLGCVSPFAVRLAARDLEGLGYSAGRIYGVSTLGSLIGTFLPTLLLIPTIGTTRTYLVFALLLLAAGLAGLLRIDPRRTLLLSWMLFVLIALTLFAGRGPIKPAPSGFTLRYEAESAYNFIQVIERPSDRARFLLLNEGQAVHSMYNPPTLITNGTWDYFLVGPFFNNPPYVPPRVKSLCVVGLAAGTISKQYSTVFGPIPIDGIEIDPAIVQAGRRYFDMNEANLNVIVEDGRWALEHSRGSYSVIGVDAYHVPTIPPQLTTVEFFQAARAHLTQEGVLVINVGRTPNDRRLIEAMTATLQVVFPSVHVMDVPNSFNSILVATVQPTATANLFANIAALPPDTHPLLQHALEQGALAVKPSVASGQIFTDDVAPVELISNSIIVSYFLTDGLQTLLNQDKSQ